MQKIVIASDNHGKIKEFEAILPEYQCCSQQEFSTPEAVENGLSFVENAIIKARNAAKYAKLPALADDSGLVVPSLGGEPGIYSARYSGGNDEDNIDTLLKNMQHITDRKAYFYCAIVLMKSENDPTPMIAVAQWHGEIITQRRGNNGFGYDSVFYIPALNKTSAELSANEKNAISHRGQALQKLKILLNPQ